MQQQHRAQNRYGQFGRRHDGGQAGGEVLARHAEEHHGHGEPERPQDQAVPADATGEHARRQVVGAQREAHHHVAAAGPQPPLLHGHLRLHASRKEHEAGAAHRGRQTAGDAQRVQRGRAGASQKAAREQRAHADDDGRQQRGVRGPPARGGHLEHEPDPRELEQQRDGDACGDEKERQVVERRGARRDQAHGGKLQALRGGKARPPAATHAVEHGQQREHGEREERLAAHHLREGEPGAVRQLDHAGQHAVARPAREHDGRVAQARRVAACGRCGRSLVRWGRASLILHGSLPRGRVVARVLEAERVEQV